MKAKLIEVGRRNINKEIETKTNNPLKEAELECRKFCLSSDVWLSPIGESLVSFGVNAGMQTVGRVEFEKAITEDQLNKYL